MKKLVKVLSQRTTITIVVLLILAVVAIGALNESNIILHAQNAATDYNGAKANEDSALLSYEDKLNETMEKISGNSSKKYYNYTVKDLSSIEDFDVLFGAFDGDKVPAVFMVGEDGTLYQCGRSLEQKISFAAFTYTSRLYAYSYDIGDKKWYDGETEIGETLNITFSNAYILSVEEVENIFGMVEGEDWVKLTDTQLNTIFTVSPVE